MPKISLTDFLDIVSKSGSPKTTAVSRVKNKAAYNPAIDFYKKIRDKLVDVHQKDGDPADLLDMSYVTDPKKMSHFEAIAGGYVKWWGNRNLIWHSPPSDTYVYHSVEVGIKPELGLQIDDKRFLIKLYFNKDDLSKSRSDIVLHMMETTLRKHCIDEVMAILDVRNSKLITQSSKIKNMNATIMAELAYIEAIWNMV